MNDWQPIETAPKDGTRFLAYWNGAVRAAAWYDDGVYTDWRADSVVLPRGIPTHWMPLPPPPRDAQ